MKSIEISVPRNLIRKLYPHPEPYGDGDYVVDLINGMYTDVFYREEGDFVTIINDKELISYLKKTSRNQESISLEMESIHYVTYQVMMMFLLMNGRMLHQSVFSLICPKIITCHYNSCFVSIGLKLEKLLLKETV